MKEYLFILVPSESGGHFEAIFESEKSVEAFDYFRTQKDKKRYPRLYSGSWSGGMLPLASSLKLIES
jgi:hypothetical protein